MSNEYQPEADRPSDRIVVGLMLSFILEGCDRMEARWRSGKLSRGMTDEEKAEYAERMARPWEYVRSRCLELAGVMLERLKDG